MHPTLGIFVGQHNDCLLEIGFIRSCLPTTLFALRAGEMTGLAKLFGCRCEQQYTPGMCGQLFDHAVFGTGLLRGPLQVVGFVNY